MGRGERQYIGPTFFENHNRYYDATLGRYLEPEPMAQEPNFVRAQGANGVDTSAYGYASNNAIAFTEADGLHDTNGCKYGSDCGSCALEAAHITDYLLRTCVQAQCRSPDTKLKCDPDVKRTCPDLTGGLKTKKWYEGGSSATGTPDDPAKEINWCELPVDSDCQTKMLVHELAHSCGWNHTPGKGVPGEGGRITGCGLLQ
jgi:RHS repeat-associated protein